VFERFRRGAPAGDDRGKGLGLAICAAVAQLHGGAVSVRNEGGARFELRLPQPPMPGSLQGHDELDGLAA
jgi:two-component system sensor histidine kinase KdpD